MKIHHLRSATCVVESNKHFVLIDPMLGAKGSTPPFSYIRFKPRRNPLVDLPPNAASILEKVTDCLITHSQKFGIKALQHTDHLDIAGENFLREKKHQLQRLHALQKY
jgi:L-ascorbate metabolism protein UlaG (beta-lactamase superfamily)